VPEIRPQKSTSFRLHITPLKNVSKKHPEMQGKKRVKKKIVVRSLPVTNMYDMTESCHLRFSCFTTTVSFSEELYILDVGKGVFPPGVLPESRVRGRGGLTYRSGPPFLGVKKRAQKGVKKGSKRALFHPRRHQNIDRLHFAWLFWGSEKPKKRVFQVFQKKFTFSAPFDPPRGGGQTPGPGVWGV